MDANEVNVAFEILLEELPKVQGRQTWVAAQRPESEWNRQNQTRRSK